MLANWRDVQYYISGYIMNSSDLTRLQYPFYESSGNSAGNSIFDVNFIHYSKPLVEKLREHVPRLWMAHIPQTFIRGLLRLKIL